MKTRYNVVSIGGGTGQSTILRALNKYSNLKLSAIVAITDCGRNSGLIRKELGLLPPGDIRNCILSLADNNSTLAKLFNHRFLKGKTFKGMSVGNLIIAALAEIYEDFEDGVNKACELLKIKGKIIPASLQSIDLCVKLKDGTHLKKEINVRKLNKDSIDTLYISPKNPKTNPKAIAAIQKADYILLGPGSLYTSVITNLLLPDIRKNIIQSKAKKIFIANLLTQPGQTDNLSGIDHIKEIIKYLDVNVLNYVIINNKKLSKTEHTFFKNQGANLLKISLTQIKKMHIIPIFAPLLNTNTLQKKEWEKHNLLQHDEKQLGYVLHNLITKIKE